MTGPPTFSVVIPTHDRPELLRETVASVVAQSVTDWECIVVDDAGSVPLPRFADPRVRVLRLDRNRGPGPALNAGVATSEGRVVVTVDDDDLWTPDRLELALAGLRRAPVAICWSRYIDDPRPAAGRMLDGDVADVILDSMIPSLGATAIQRTKWMDVCDDLRTCQDVEWWLRVAGAHPVATVPQVGHLVRRHPGARHGAGSAARRRDNRALLDMHRPWFDAHPRAEAFRLRRDAHYAMLTGDRRGAARSLRRSLRLQPSARTAKQLVLSVAGRPRPEA